MALEVITIFSVIAGIIFIGFIGELAFRKTKVPDVIFLILIGIILGSVLHLVDKNSFGIGSTLFTTFTLLFLLYQGALSIDFKTLFQSFRDTLKITIISFILTVAVISVIANILLGYPLLLSLLLGMVLGGTCSAVVIPFVNILPMDRKYKSVLTLESAINDVLCIVGTITLIAIFKTGNIGAADIVKTIITSFLLAGSIGIIAGIIWIFLLYKSPILGEYHMVTIAMIISIFSLVESPFVGASGAIAALSFGLMLGNSRSIIKSYYSLIKGDNSNEEKHETVINSVLSDKATSFYSEISFFVKVFFFVYLGILIDFSNPWAFFYGGLISLGIFMVRPIAVKLAFWSEPMEKSDRSVLNFLVPKGLASAVLIDVATQAGIISGNGFTNTVFSVIIITTLFSSILVFWTQRK